MKRILYILILIILSGSISLIAFAPDTLSMIFSCLMFGIIIVSLIFGLLPMLSFRSGMINGEESLIKILSIQSDSIWTTIEQKEKLFRQKTLDSLFEAYKGKVQVQKNTGQPIGDVDDYINEDVLGLKCWNNVLIQIPGTLTGLGILGTFIGLIMGVSGIGFSSVEAALLSVETLLHGINIAFYTSISGVILSICFNILHKISWNLTTREINVFLEDFHRYVIPPVEEQSRFIEMKNMAQILDRLDRIPKNPGFSISNVGAVNYVAGVQQNEKILMPQIIEGIKNKEFTFVLQPKYDINTRKIVAAEAYVRWNHERLGMVSPAVFLPILEENGYITKLDEFVWESVCKQLRKWIDEGIRIVPVSINVSKTDVLAGNVLDKLESLMEQYKLPPRMLEIEIARNAYIEVQDITSEIAYGLQRKGFKVILDGFDGDYVPLHAIPNLYTDELKLDLRKLDFKEHGNLIRETFEHAKQIPQSIAVEGIESMEQLSMLRKLGCTIGQGFFFSKPITQEEFIDLLA